MTNQARQRSKKHRIRKQVIDIGISEVQVTLAQDGQQKVLIKLLDCRRIINVLDRCTYEKGECIRLDRSEPGDEATRVLGQIYSSYPGIGKVQFRQRNGIFLHIAYDHSNFRETLRDIAIALLKRSEIVARAQLTSP